MTMITYNDFSPENVISLTTDRSFDFAQKWPDGRLTEGQKKFLNEKFRISIEGDINIKQVHSDNILIADKRSNGDIIEADGVITDQVNVPIVIRTADCLPVFFYDSDKKCIGLMHCGWKSTQKKILHNALSLMKERFGCNMNDIKAALGPCIRKCCYTVGEDFFRYFKNVHKQGDLNYFDIARENKDQLLDAGVAPDNMYDCGICTFCNEEYFSFRREGEGAGRMLSLMMMRP